MQTMRVVRRWAVAGLTVALVSAGSITGSQAQVTARRSPTLVPGGGLDDFTPASMPLGVSKRQTTVMVQVAGDPVTVQDANVSRSMTDDQKAQAKKQLKDEQRPVGDRVRALGGTVVSDYQEAYNGVKVRIDASKTAQLAAIPNVVGVRRLTLSTPDNIHGVPLIGAPNVWGGTPGLNGQGMKIAIIDTGIDYTHADFGGPATPGAYQVALAHDTEPADPALFGPNAPKIKGGIDLVGDSYNANPNDANYQPVPHPDPNPLDCAGHGTHVAGTAAGFGVLSDGTTYHGGYDAGTVASHSWNVGPGVAPGADLYAVRVFGCTGSTDVVVDAIEWAVSHHMDVINMSLGAPLVGADGPDAVAAADAVRDGVIVVAAAGNSGQTPYLTGSPASGNGVISVAASDPTSSFPAASLTLSTGPTVQALDANGVPVGGLGSLPVKVLWTPGAPHDAAHISLGCDPNEYTALPGVAGALVVVRRGTCARISRPIYGQRAGASAVLMVNNAAGFPPQEGKITVDPVTGQPYTVTIPFLGVPADQAPALAAAAGGSATLTDSTIANPGYLTPADFTSGGPRGGDSALKPDLTGPGVNIASAFMGTGTDAAVFSGTSMATPHTAGAAALVRQAHPSWKTVRYWNAALINTADPGLVNGYSPRVSGSGLVQAQWATRTQVVAIAGEDSTELNFGYREVRRNLSRTRRVTLTNLGNSPATFAVSTTNPNGSPHSVVLKVSSVTVAAGSTRDVDVELDVPAATAGDSGAFHDVAGLVTFTPAAGSNNGAILRVPYYLVPRAVSHITTELDDERVNRTGSLTATVINEDGVIAGNADWYAWGLTGTKVDGQHSNDLNAVGVQAFPGVLAFGISSQQRWSNPTENEFDVFVDVNGDGIDDYAVVSVDLGSVTAGSPNGILAVVVVDLRTNRFTLRFLADAPFNSTTMALPVRISQLCRPGSPCLSVANPRFTYHVVSFSNLDNNVDSIDAPASFNAFTPAISTGMFDTVAPGATATEAVTINSAEWAKTPAKGVMILSHDNASDEEAQLIPLSLGSNRDHGPVPLINLAGLAPDGAGGPLPAPASSPAA